MTLWDNNINIFSFIKRKGLARNLARLLIISIMLPVIFIGVISVTSSYNSIINKSKEGFTSTTYSTGMYINSALKNVEQNLLQLITNNIILDYYSETSTLYAKPVARENAINMISNIINNNNLISGIHILTDRETTISYPMESVTFIYDFDKIKNSNWYKDIQSFNGKPIWIDNHNEAYDEVSIKNGYKIEPYAFSIGVSYIDMRTQKKMGVVLFDISENKLKEILKGIKLSKNGFIVAATSQGKLISPENALIKISNNTPFINNINNKIKTKQYSGAFVTEISHKRILACYSYSTYSKLTYISIIPLSDLISTATRLRNLIIIVSLIFTLMVLIISIYSASKLVYDVEKITNIISTAANGNLNVNSVISRNDEIGILSESFNKMAEQLRDLIIKGINLSSQVKNSIENVLNISNEVSLVTNNITSEIREIASGAGNQAQEANNIMKRVTSFGEKIDNVALASKEMDVLSSQVNNYTNIGLDTLKELNRWTEQTAVVATSMISNIYELSTHTKSIGKIITLLNTISEQTKLLALNASIEAAKAGEHGRGFSVVAAEIRKLADQSRNSTKDIENILKKIIKQTETTQDVADNVENIIKGQIKAVEGVSKSFNNIIDAMKKLSDKFDDINSSIIIIDAEKNEITESIESISAISQETAASSEQVSSATQEQQAAIEELSSLINNLYSLAKDLEKQLEFFVVE